MPLNNTKVGEFIAQQRKSRGLTQNEVADKLLITYQAVSKWERGETLPDVSLLPNLAQLLETTVDDILSPGSNEQKKVLEDVQMGSCMTSYAAAAYGCLKAAGFWQDDMIRFMGMTGLAFRFVVRKDTCPSSPTVYNWQTVHMAMMDRIGVHSDCYLANSEASRNTIELIRTDAEARIRDAVDKGAAVVAWAPSQVLEFGIINGYDDVKKVFNVRDVTGRQDIVLPYSELGSSEVPELFYQIFRAKVNVDEDKTCRDVLRYALSEWNQEHYPYASYGSGKKAYQNLICAIEENDLYVIGLSYIISVYGYSKYCASEFLKSLAVEASYIGLDRAAALFGHSAANYKKMSELLPFGPDVEAFHKNRTELLAMIRDSLSAEEEAMRLIAAYVSELSDKVVLPSNAG